MPLSLFPHCAVALERRFTSPFGINVLLLIDIAASGARPIKETPDENGRLSALDTSLVPMAVFYDVARPGCSLGRMIAALHAADLTMRWEDSSWKTRHCKGSRSLDRVTGQEVKSSRLSFCKASASRPRLPPDGMVTALATINDSFIFLVFPPVKMSLPVASPARTVLIAELIVQCMLSLSYTQLVLLFSRHKHALLLEKLG